MLYFLNKPLLHLSNLTPTLLLRLILHYFVLFYDFTNGSQLSVLSNGYTYFILDLSELGVDMRLFREEALLHLGDTSEQMIHIEFARGGLCEIQVPFYWLLIFVGPERKLVILLVELGAH